MRTNLPTPPIKDTTSFPATNMVLYCDSRKSVSSLSSGKDVLIVYVKYYLNQYYWCEGICFQNSLMKNFA